MDVDVDKGVAVDVVKDVDSGVDVDVIEDVAAGVDVDAGIDVVVVLVVVVVVVGALVTGNKSSLCHMSAVVLGKEIAGAEN